jgi:cytochrome P450
MTPGEQPIVLDVEGKDIQGEGARLRERGAVTLVELTGSVRVWAVGGHRGLRQILSDPRVSRNANLHWAEWKRGEIPEDWPLRIWATVQNMGNAYGGEHRRLRDPVAAALTARRHCALGSSASPPDCWTPSRPSPATIRLTCVNCSPIRCPSR